MNQTNNWIILSLLPKKGYGLCRCSCGVEKAVYIPSIRNNSSKSCGKCRSDVSEGFRFGEWTVIKKMDDKPVGESYWKCECSCGTQIVKSTARIKYAIENATKLHCGCKHELVGTTCGNLTVLEKIPKHKSGRSYFICKCSCGKITTVRGSDLKNKSSTSCGCKRYY